MGLLLRLAERTDKFKILNINVDVKISVSKKIESLENADVFIRRLNILQSQKDTSLFTFLDGFTGPFSQNIFLLFYVYVYV